MSDLSALHRVYIRAEARESDALTRKCSAQIKARSMNEEDLAASLAAEREWHLASEESAAARSVFFDAQRKAVTNGGNARG